MTTAPVAPDVFARELRPDPYPLYRRLREEGRLHRTAMGAHLVTRYEDCAEVLLNPVWGHGYDEYINPFRPGVEPDRVAGAFLRMDPPDHTRLRSLVSRAFTPRVVDALRPRIAEIADALLDAALEADYVDLVPALAYPLPLTVICEMLGVPPEDHAFFHRWSPIVSHGLDPDHLLTPDQIAARDEARAQLDQYFMALVAERRLRPRDDVISGLVAAEERGDTLTLTELVAICHLLLVGGHETTVNLLTGGVLALGRHPDQRALLTAEPGLAARAVDEFLRYDPPVPAPTRVALRDLELAGESFPRGSGVIVLIGSANRDPEAFPDPERLDITRYGGPVPAKRHLAFSLGLHYCLGAQLARVEGEIAFDRLVRRAPRFAVDVDGLSYRDNVAIRGLATLPVRLSGE